MLRYLLYIFLCFSVSLKAQLKRGVEKLAIDIEEIDDGLLQYPDLKILEIKYSNFLESKDEKNIPEVVFKLTSLKELYILRKYPYGWLNKIPPAIGRLTNLEILAITGHSIGKLPEEITNLKKLKTLDLTENDINDTASLIYITHLHQLRELNLGGNDINYLPKTFNNLKLLNKLNLDQQFAEGLAWGESFEKFPVIIFELENLEELSLDGHYFEEIPPELDKMKFKKYSNYNYPVTPKDQLETFLMELSIFGEITDIISTHREKANLLLLDLDVNRTFRAFQNTENGSNILQTGIWFYEEGEITFIVWNTKKFISHEKIESKLWPNDEGRVTFKVKIKDDNLLILENEKTKKQLKFKLFDWEKIYFPK